MVDGRARKIPDALWNTHRNRIVELYQTKGLQGEDGVMAWMVKEHSFKASKAQYEHKLKNWGARKYLKRKHWEEAIGIHTQRERLGKQSKIFINGTAVSEERLLRERARYGSSSTTRLESMINASYTNPSGLIVALSPAHSPVVTAFTPVMQDADILPNSDILDLSSQVEVTHHRDTSQDALFTCDFDTMIPPFSWVATLDWSSIESLTTIRGDIIKRPTLLSKDCKALFHQTHQLSISDATSNTSTIFVKWLVAVMLNNIQPSSGPDLDDIHEWLRSLPQSTVLKFFRSLPAAHFDVLRERVFAAAVRADHEPTVRAMLDLGVDASCAIDMGSNGTPEPLYPLQMALHNESFSIAKVIVFHLLQNSQSNPSELLTQILRCYDGAAFRSDPIWSKLVRTLLDAKAKPTIPCFEIVRDDIKLARHILVNHEGGARGWMAKNILVECLNFCPHNAYQREYLRYEPMILLIYSYTLQEQVNQLRGYHETEFALRRALRKAMEIQHTPAMNMILNAFSQLEIKVVDSSDDDHATKALLAAYHAHDWQLITQLETERAASAQSTLRTTLPYPVLPESESSNENIGEAQDKVIIMEPSDSGRISLLEEIRYVLEVERNDEDLNNEENGPGLEELARRLQKENIENLEPLSRLCYMANTLGYNQLTAAILARLEREGWGNRFLISNLFKRTDIAVIGEIISINTNWNDTLRFPRNEKFFYELENVVFRKHNFQGNNPIFLGGLLTTDSLNQQIALQSLAYYGIYLGDYSLLEWLFNTGLSTGELYCMAKSDEVRRISEIGPSEKHQVKYRGGEFWLPSLLSAAVVKKDTDMIRFLFSKQVKTADSFALMRAVTHKASTEVIELLLSRIGDEGLLRRSSIGAAALRAAICKKDYTTLRLLLKKANVDGVEILEIFDDNNQLSSSVPCSPLGEAIFRKDLKAVKILLKHNVKLNGLVTFRGDELPDLMEKKRGTVLQRVSPLLAAIDIGYFAMVQLLVENGAEFDHGPRLGLCRTPLQRAAELNNLEIVQYLLERGAPPDSAPFYSGGTPLQLAALGGFVGVAKLLLEKGANVNHLPAKGDGRTALEAAVEWGRIDMISELVERHADFELMIDGHTQYERALKFAERRGQLASKRFIEQLRKIYWPAFLNPEACS